MATTGDDMARLLRCMERMTEPVRTAFLLRKRDLLEHDAIAERMQISEDELRSLLQAAVREVAREFMPDDIHIVGR